MSREAFKCMWQVRGEFCVVNISVFACKKSGIHNDPPKTIVYHQALKRRAELLHLLKKQPFQRDFPEYTKIYKKETGETSFST